MNRFFTFLLILAACCMSGCVAKMAELGLIGENHETVLSGLFPTGVSREGSPSVQESLQLKENFYLCKTQDGKKWGEATSEFSADDPRLYAIAKLDRSREKVIVLVELMNTNGQIMARSRRDDYKPGDQLGFAFSPPKLLKEGSSGEWRAVFWCDGDPVGYADFKMIGEEEVLEEDVQLTDEPSLNMSDEIIPSETEEIVQIHLPEAK